MIYVSFHYKNLTHEIVATGILKALSYGTPDSQPTSMLLHIFPVENRIPLPASS
jgi:hypothetical protein